MTRDQIERVFGRGRLKMVTGEHVEVFREAVVPGERRRYTKRFLNSTDGDFAHWTEREWRILARLIGHGIGCVPDVVQFDRGSAKGAQLVQTYDAGVTVDQWATLLPLSRDGHLYRHAFEDCAHWWALAHYCLAALKEIHQLQLVHLDIKGDNVCIPFGPANFEPEAAGATLYPLFGQLALIDFAFSLVSGESLAVALPIGWQREYDYQSPRLLRALVEGHEGDLRKTRELDWRCDLYSLAAMLKRYLPDALTVRPPERATGWTSQRYDAATALIVSLRHCHDGELPQRLPHQAMIDATGEMLRESDLAQSLASGWTLARDVALASGVAAPITPMTRIAPPIRVFRKPRERASPDARSVRHPQIDTAVPLLITRRSEPPRPSPQRKVAAPAVLAAAFTVVLGAAVAHQVFPGAVQTLSKSARELLDDTNPRADTSARADASAASAQGAGAARPPDADPQSVAGAGSKAADADPAPPVASSPKLSGTDGPSATPGDDPDDRNDQESAQRDEPAESAAAAKTDAASPPLSRMSPKAAAPSDETARTTGKRATTKSAPLPATRPSAPVTTARTPPNRSPAAPPRTAATIVASRSNAGSVSTPTQGAHVVTSPMVSPGTTAPIQVIELVPPPGQSESGASAPTPAAQSAQTVAPSSSVAAQGQQAAPAPESAAPASKPAKPTRRARAADEEWRAGLNALSQFFGFTKRKSAPVEDRGFQEVVPGAKPSRAPVPQPASPVPEPSITAAPRLDSPPSVAMATPAPRVVGSPLALATPAPRSSPPPPPMPDPRTAYGSADRSSDYALQARRSLAHGVPRLAAQTQIEIANVLWAAAKAQDPRGEREVIDHAQAISVRDGATAYSQTVEPAAARRLNEDAMQAYWVRRNVPEAFDLSLKAFGANPNDPEIAGNLAFLHLRMSPVQAETARQLALHALAVRGARFRAGRLEDWNTYALASALTGRETDARNAMYVTVALAGSVERNCKAGLSAIANYGERVREPVEAMLYRIHTQGRSYESPYCAWPPNWAMGMRRP